jgi:lipoyl-dependent peroxiredoxin
VPRIERTADVTWEGNLARGTGHISGGSGALADLPYSLPTRIGKAEGKTSPEELLAAAHAGCLTMSLTGELTEAGTPPERLEVTCRIVMDEVDGKGHQIVAAQVTIRGTDDSGAVERADAGCPFSTLLRDAGVDVSVELA